PENEVLAQYHKKLAKYKSKPVSRKGTSEREEQTLKFLEKFKNSMEKAKMNYTEEKSSDEEDESWLVHCLRANDEKTILAKDANLPTGDRYDLSDPRNPINERRRKEKKMKK
ncbi:hypothetical protein CEXT_551241, partial [Caerostris extrusa]